MGSNTDAALATIFDLHKRHADQVFDALVSLIRQNASRLVDGTMPATSPIGIAAGLSKELGVDAAHTVSVVTDRATEHDLSFRIDPDTFSVWNGGKQCQLGNTIEFRAISRLARRPEVYVSIEKLLDDAWEGDMRTKGAVQKTISNLRRRFRESELDGVEIDGAQRGHYALKISETGKR